MSHVTEFPAAASTVAVNHFLSRLSLETDCADVHE
ncbi:rhodanese-like domain-containing protein, partial [Proteus mirabilis]|nr:rhodanese-like domain-containing protein [Proteus mirabilis]